MYRFMRNQWFFMFAALLFVNSARAQMGIVPYGLGMYAAMQGCSMPYGTASGSVSVSDAEKNIMKRIEKLEREKEKQENKVESLKEKEKRNKKTINDSFESDFAEFVVAHIENNRVCSSYKGITSGSSATEVREGGSTTERKSKEEAPEAEVPEKYVVAFLGDTNGNGAKCSVSTKGFVSESVCNGKPFRVEGGSKKVSVDLCKKALRDYRTNYSDRQAAATEVENITGEIEELEYSLEEKEEERIAKAERKRTQGGVCTNCSNSSIGGEVNLAYTGANLLTALVAGYAGYQQDKRVVQANAQLGFPTNPGSSYVSYGFPFLMNGIYGALGGQVGAGGIGCAGGIGGGGYPYGPMGMMGNPYGYGPQAGMGGAFGYPMDMFGNPIGGGMYMPGMGSWGPNGPFGMSPYGPYGPYGFMINGMVNAMMNGGGNMMGGYPMMGGAMLGGYMGNMMGGGMLGGYMGNMMGGGGMLGGYMNNMIGGMGVMNAMMNGGGNMMGGYLGNFMGGGYMNNMMGGGVLGGAQGSLQMLQLQQQMAQQQMQMQQQMMQAQMQAQQQYMVQQQQRQQQVTALYSELNSLVYRIQSIQSGAASGLAGYGGITGYGGLSGSVGIGGVMSIGGVAPVPGMPYGNSYMNNTYPYPQQQFPYNTQPYPANTTIRGR